MHRCQVPPQTLETYKVFFKSRKGWHAKFKEWRQLTTTQETHIFHKSYVGSMVSLQPPWKMCCKESISVQMLNQHFVQLKHWGQPLFHFNIKENIRSLINKINKRRMRGNEKEKDLLSELHMFFNFWFQLFLWNISFGATMIRAYIDIRSW